MAPTGKAEIDVNKRFAIAADAALLLVDRRATVPPNHALVAPTLRRSQVLAQRYAAVRHGGLRKRGRHMAGPHQETAHPTARRAVLQRHAWSIASKLDWADTYCAEYIAVTLPQADVLATSDTDPAAARNRLSRFLRCRRR